MSGRLAGTISWCFHRNPTSWCQVMTKKTKKVDHQTMFIACFRTLVRQIDRHLKDKLSENQIFGQIFDQGVDQGLGEGKSINTVHSTTRPKEKPFKYKKAF